MNNELELTEKLLTTFHLNSNERKLLDEGKVKLSLIKQVIEDKLHKFGWFPQQWRPDLPFSGGLIEYLSVSSYKFYHKEETSLSNYQIVEAKKYSNLDKVVIAFLKNMFGSNIDSIPIDYNS